MDDTELASPPRILPNGGAYHRIGQLIRRWMGIGTDLVQTELVSFRIVKSANKAWVWVDVITKVPCPNSR